LQILLIFVASFGVALSGALSPGPLLTVTISESAKRGFRAGPLLIVGHSILELTLVFGLIFGLSSFLNQRLVLGIISLLGGGFLLWMGYSLVTGVRRGEISFELPATKERSGLNPLYLGILASLSNPYWTLWWATIGAGLLLTALKLGLAGLASFFIGHIAADFAWYSLVSAMVAGGRNLLKGRFYHALMLICGLFLILLSIYFFITGIRFVQFVL